MRIWISLLCLCVPCMGFAQKALSEVARAAEGVNAAVEAQVRAAAAAQEAVRQAQQAAQAAMQLQIPQVMPVFVPPTQLPGLKFDTPYLDGNFVQEAFRRYMQGMEAFMQFRRESASFLYYQSKPSEQKALFAQERAYWLDKMDHVNRQLAGLQGYISPQDPALASARSYMLFAMNIVDPLQVHTLMAPSMQARTDRELNVFEFYLHEPPAQADAPLPENLQIVLLNDEESWIQYVELMHQRGRFLAGSSLKTARSAKDFLARFKARETVPDILLTDMVFADGTGYYIADELRRAGYQGVILALTSSAETDNTAHNLFDHGFDGMISLNEAYLDGLFKTERIEWALRTYLQYSRANGWKHTVALP